MDWYYLVTIVAVILGTTLIISRYEISVMFTKEKHKISFSIRGRPKALQTLSKSIVQVDNQLNAPLE